MRIRILSDIHLELATNPTKYMKQFIPSTYNHEYSDILILAGDIGNPTSKIYKLFLTEVSKYYAKVFVITGNHEYYQSSHKNYDKRIGKSFGRRLISIESIDNMIELITSSLLNVRFLGCTLWSTSDSTLTKYINDYEYITDMTATKCNELNSYDINWLHNQLIMKGDDYDQTIVITHHLPSYKLIDDIYKNHPLNTFFANHLDHLVEKADIWICGHSHKAKHITIGTCECYLNPVGYYEEQTGYNITLTLELQTMKSNCNITYP
jgi:predicted phosphodiesterase